jgi:hypothetical protein
MRMSATSKKGQTWSVQETGRVAGRAAGRGRGPEKANRQGVGAGFSFLSSKLPAGERVFDRFLHQAFAIRIQRYYFGQNLHFVIERHPRFVHIGLTPYLFSARRRRCDGFFHVAFRLLWQWTHPAAGQEPDTRIFARTVKDDCAFLCYCAIKAFRWMGLDDLQELLVPRIPFKVRELFNNVAQLSDAHALQRFLDGFPPLFTQSFHIYKFIEWHRWLLPLIKFEVDTSMEVLSEKTTNRLLA